MANKDLISMAAGAGIEVKSSALASVSKDEADQLRAIAAGGGKPTATAVEEPPAAVAPPRREKPAEREIRDLRTKPTPGHRARPAVSEEVAPEPLPVAEEPAAVEPVTVETPLAEAEAAEEPSVAETVVEAVKETAEAVVEKAPEVVETVVETVTEAAAAVVETASEAVAAVKPTEETATEPAQSEEQAAAVEAAAAEPVAEAADTKAETAAVEEPAAKAAASAAATPAAEKTDGKPSDEVTGAVKKSDYVAPAGEAAEKPKKKRLLGIRDMQAVGTVRAPKGRKKKTDGEDGGPPRKDKDRKSIAPNIVRPNFTGPKGGEPKADEPAAQKPDISFSPDFTANASPLGQQMKDQKKRPGSGAGAGRPGRMVGPTNAEARRNKRSVQQKQGFVHQHARIQRGSHRRKKKRLNPADLKSEAMVESPVTIRELSEAIGRPINNIIGFFMKQGEMKQINAFLTDDEALEVSLELGVELQFKDRVDLEEVLAERLEDFPEDVETFIRPPIVTILGHVDHGKTTLVDALRGSNVTEGEAGGITQHIAAYQVRNDDGQAITFIDTPGHAAFGSMRARGADVTDIIVIVVAADDGVMPQTVESIAHAKEAGVPIIVAMNKMDLPDVNEQKVFTDLAQHGLQPQEWGGETEVVRVSALKGDGVDDLIETILLTAEIEELGGATEMQAHGLCLEGFRDEGRGPMAWAIVQQGDLKVGDNVVCGGTFGRVRAMYDENDNELQSAGPSTPIKFTGLNDVPMAGVHFFELDEIDEARELAQKRIDSGLKERLLKRGSSAKSLEEILAGEGPRELPLIIKGDTPGSVEAIRSELEKFEHDEVAIRILHDGIGGVNESDVYLAATSGAMIVAFQVIAEDAASSLADKEEVTIRRYSIIYELLDDIRNSLEGLLEPERREVPTGRAIVLQTFPVSRVGTIAGCRILSGTIERNNRMHVIRDQTVVGTYPVGSLRREKDDVKEVREGMECGIRLENFNDVKEGDLLEGFRIEEIARKLDG